MPLVLQSLSDIELEMFNRKSRILEIFGLDKAQIDRIMSHENTFEYREKIYFIIDSIYKKSQSFFDLINQGNNCKIPKTIQIKNLGVSQPVLVWQTAYIYTPC